MKLLDEQLCETQYTSECTMKVVTEIMKLRFNVVKIKNDLVKHEQCRMCVETEESTENILKCDEISEEIRWKRSKNSKWTVASGSIQEFNDMVNTSCEQSPTFPLTFCYC